MKDAPANTTSTLSLADYIAQEILMYAQTGTCVSSAQVRLALRGKTRLKASPKLAILVQDEIKALMDAGLLKPVADDDSKARPKGKGKPKPKPKAKGRKAVRFEKCSWAEVSAHPQALPLVTRLLLTADSFHSH